MLIYKVSRGDRGEKAAQRFVLNVYRCVRFFAAIAARKNYCVLTGFRSSQRQRRYDGNDGADNKYGGEHDQE